MVKDVLDENSLLKDI